MPCSLLSSFSFHLASALPFWQVPWHLISCFSTHIDRAGVLAAIGRLCEKCDGKCVVCDSYVRPCVLVRICDECNYGSYAGRCVICGGVGISDAYYCKECALQEKDVSTSYPVCCSHWVALTVQE